MTSSGPAAGGARPRSQGDYAFLRRPVWIGGAMLALTAVVLFVSLGFWQLRRWEERKDRNELISSRIDRQAEPLSDVVPDLASPPGDAEWRRVVATGRYAYEDEVFLRSQSYRGTSGLRVLTPLRLDGGAAVIVDRGWVPLDTPGPPAGEGPAGEVVSVTGVLRSTQDRGAFGPVDPAEGTLDRVSRVDLARLQQQLGYPVYPMWVQILRNSDDAVAAAPIPADPPELGEGPHLSYAVQWFSFTAIVLAGFPILLYRTAHRRPRRIRPKEE